MCIVYIVSEGKEVQNYPFAGKLKNMVQKSMFVSRVLKFLVFNPAISPNS